MKVFNLYFFLINRWRSILLFCSFLFLFLSSNPINKPYWGVKEWEKTREKRIKEFKSWKFGMFIHWGLYSVPGGYWKGKKYSQPYAEWIKRWSGASSLEYDKELKQDFINSVKKDPFQKIAELAKKAGMKYAVLTTKHHDGYTLFNSTHPYSVKNNVIKGSTRISPPGRDLVKEYADAFRKEDISVGLYYSIIDWQHPNYTPKNQQKFKKYISYINYHIKELMKNYGEIRVLWPDYTEVKNTDWRLTPLLKNMLKWQPNIVMNNRFTRGIDNENWDFFTPEKEIPNEVQTSAFEVCHTMNESFGFSYHDKKWKTPAKSIKILVDIVSKGGNFLYNVGPDKYGNLPKESITILEEMGKWMDINANAIYGTEKSILPLKKKDFRYFGSTTTKIKNGYRVNLVVYPSMRTSLGEICLKNFFKEKPNKAYFLKNNKKIKLKKYKSSGYYIDLEGQDIFKTEVDKYGVVLCFEISDIEKQVKK